MDFHELPPGAERPFEILARKAGGERAALDVLRELSSQMGTDLQHGLTGPVPDQVVAAIALIRGGMSAESVSSMTTWQDSRASVRGS